MTDGKAKGVRDAQYLTEFLTRIRQVLPTAATVNVSTSDQGLYGFVLGAVTDHDGTRLTVPSGLDDELSDLISDLDWDGVVGEDEGGYAALSLKLLD